MRVRMAGRVDGVVDCLAGWVGGRVGGWVSGRVCFGRAFALPVAALAPVFGCHSWPPGCPCPSTSGTWPSHLCPCTCMAPTPLPPADYQLEAGATRNYEPWRDKEKVVAQAVASREDEEKGNARKASCWLLLGPFGHTLLPAGPRLAVHVCGVWLGPGGLLPCTQLLLGGSRGGLTPVLLVACSRCLHPHRTLPALQALENRTLDSKREMDILSALDEMRSLRVGWHGR